MRCDACRVVVGRSAARSPTGAPGPPGQSGERHEASSSAADGHFSMSTSLSRFVCWSSSRSSREPSLLASDLHPTFMPSRDVEAVSAEPKSVARVAAALAAGDSASDIMAELSNGSRWLARATDSTGSSKCGRLAIITYRIATSSDDGFTLDEDAFRSAMAAAEAEKVRAHSVLTLSTTVEHSSHPVWGAARCVCATGGLPLARLLGLPPAAAVEGV